MGGVYNPFNLNLYAYSHQNPVKYIDPDGKHPIAHKIEKGIKWLSKTKAGRAVTNTKVFKAVEKSFKKASRFIDSKIEQLAKKALDWVGSKIDNNSLQSLQATSKIPIWSAGKTGKPIKNALEHWNKHKSEFIGIYKSPKEYVQGALNFVKNPSPGTLSKISKSGDVLLYNPKRNIFAVKNALGAPKTMFRPRKGIEYFNKQ